MNSSIKKSLFKAINLIIILCISLTVSLHAQTKIKLYNLASYGILPNSGKNSTPMLSGLLKKIKTETTGNVSVVIKFQKGRYDFYPEAAAIRTYYISNHDQDNPKTVGIALENFKNLTIEGNEADLMFHGRMLPIALIESNNIKLKNLSIDFEKPQITQIKIIENDTINGQIVFETASWVKYLIKDSVFYNTGEGWQMQPTSGIAFENATKRIIYKSGDIRVGTKGVAELSPGKIKAYRWKNSKLIPGTVIAMRSWQRPAPGIFIHKAKNISLTNVKVHYAEGMGLLAQLTENIYMDGFAVCLRGKNDPRYFTTQADATHFSGCKGKIVSKNGLYEGMMDDAINIHGTYLKVTKKIDNKTVIGRYMHGQSYGFDWGYIKDSVQFIQSKTMELWNGNNTIASIVPIKANENDPIKEFKIEFVKELSDEIDPSKLDIGIENLTWTPSVIFTGNTIRNNRARGTLFSTPKPTLVAHNLFDHTSGCAILLCGDSNGWYETGACKDVEISNNKFVNALTSMYQFTNAVISIYPEIPDLKNQKKYFHSGIRIRNNEFETFDRPILYAKSVDGLVFKDNTITSNKDYPAFHFNKNRINFDRVTRTEISNNKIDGIVTDTLIDVMSINWSRFQKKAPNNKLVNTVKETLLNANKFALTTWYDSIKNYQPDSTGYLDLKSKSKVNEYRYRFPAAMSFGVAIAIKTEIYDASITGISLQEAKDKTIMMIRAIAYDHKINGTRKVWGGDWQAAHWAYYAGYTAWLLWDDFSMQDQTYIRQMIIAEADRFLATAPLYYKDNTGKILFPGDSKIEEDAWNAELLYLSAVMLPGHSHSNKWLYKAVEYMIAATSLPSDLHNKRIIHGKPVSSWVHGYNLEEPGFVINHGIIHPQYNALASMINAPIVFSLAGKPTPEAARFNLDKIYYSVTAHHFLSPPYKAPGGTMYKEGTAEVYYPEGSDWGFAVYDNFANLDIAAFTYGWDNLAQKNKGEYWAKLHIDKVLNQQKRFTDRHTYSGDNENSYPGREEAIASRMGSGWMTIWLQQQSPAVYDNKPISK